MTILGIDFGTSRIKAAYWDEGRGEAVMLPLGKGGRLYVPSLFHVAKDGRIRFGDEAEMMLHHDPLGVLENLKLKLDKPIQYGSNGVTAKSAELMSLLFGRLIEYAAREAKPFAAQAPEKLVLTLPSRWDYGDIYRDALETAGYSGEVVFLREPEAAAWAWIAEAESAVGDVLVVLDFGGGTVDWATVQVDEHGRPVMIPELPPGGITAAGAHVDEGLFDEMMNRLGDEQRKYALQHRSLLMEQIRQMKESQNSRSSLSGEGGEILEIMLGPDMFRFERTEFEQVVKREAVDQALEGVGGYVKKVIRYAKGVGKVEIACVLVGGTRMLAGLEEQVKARLLEIGKGDGVEVRFAALGQADFATARGTVRGLAPKKINPVPDNFNEQQINFIKKRDATPVRSFTGHTDAVNSIAYSSDGRYLASCGWDETIRIWDLGTGRCLRGIAENSMLECIAYSPDGKCLATGSYDGIKILSLEGGKTLRTLPRSRYMNWVSYSPCGKYLAAQKDDFIKIWDVINGDYFRNLKEYSDINSFVYSCDGKSLIIGFQNEIKVWDITSQCYLHEIYDYMDEVNSVACSPDGKYLASAGNDYVKVWDKVGGVCLKKFNIDTTLNICPVKYSPDGNLLAFSTYENTIRILDIEKEEYCCEFYGHSDAVKCIAFSPDGKYLASGSDDNTIKIWSIE